MRAVLMTAVGAFAVTACGPMNEAEIGGADAVAFSADEIASASVDIHEEYHEDEFEGCDGEPTLLKYTHHLVLRSVELTSGAYHFGFSDVIKSEFDSRGVTYVGSGNFVAQENSNTRSFNTAFRMMVRGKAQNGSRASIVMSGRFVMDANGTPRVETESYEVTCD